MDEKSLEWKDRFTMIWDPEGRGEYRRGSAGQRYARQFLEYVPFGSIINEYGSGTGRATVQIVNSRPDVHANMIDIAENALEDPAKELIGNNVTFTLASLSRLPHDFPIADWGYCVGVLMLVAPESLDEILHEIHRTCRNLFVEVYDWPDIRCGIDLTTIKADPDWWAEKLRETWRDVEFIQSTEHKRRYVFVCRGDL